MQRFTDVAIFNHQRGGAPVGDDAMVDVLSERPRRNGGSPGVKEEAQAEREVRSRIPFAGIQFSKSTKRAHPLSGRRMKHACSPSADTNANQRADDERFY
ncbi:hypothetical protein SDC9_155346 [bioreactor metagenome]|uniref:Uncharacterized protein n=1 Tax=bioreactor metagenome TaxID=1076179 RepID=A0A645F2M2_9ZZZZ